MTTEAQLLNIVDNIFSSITTVDVVHGNQSYDGTNEEWMRVSLKHVKSERVTLGNNPLYRYWGICAVQIFVRPDTGEGRAREIADLVTPLLRDQNVQGVQFFVPEVVPVGEENSWYQVNVLTKFYRED